jgi:hypothetical protein
MKLNRDSLRKLPRALRIEVEENARRESLTQSELAHEQRRILQELRKHKSPGTRTDLKGGEATSGKALPEVHATSVVGALYGESRTQVEKRLAVVAAAEAEPEKFGKLLEDMDRSGKVNPVYKRLRVHTQADQIRAEPPPLPGRGPYRVIVAHPPWPFEIRQKTRRIVLRGLIRRCRSNKYAPCTSRRSRMKTASFGCGPSITTCARLSTF